MPNVIGKQRSEAIEALREAGLRPVVEEEETEVPSQIGRVLDQFPPPGTELERAGLGSDDRRRQAGRPKRSRKKKKKLGRSRRECRRIGG